MFHFVSRTKNLKCTPIHGAEGVLAVVCVIVHHTLIRFTLGAFTESTSMPVVLVGWSLQ